MLYIRIDDYIYFQNEGLTQLIGSTPKVETIRIDNETVSDVTYQFDLELGQYVEQSRTQRAEPMPLAPVTIEDKIKKVETAAEVLDERTQGMQAIDDFTLQAQATIDDRTIGMQAIDDFTLEMVTDLQSQVAQLQADIAVLKGGA